MRVRRSVRLPAVGVAAAALLLLLGAGPSPAQSALERPPNLGDGWVSRAGMVHFNLVHRFSVVGDVNKVTVSPTLTLAAGLPGGLLAGAAYASNSTVSLPARVRPNEFEAFLRWRPLRGEEGEGPLSLQLAYNLAAASVDGEVAGRTEIGPLALVASARAFSRPFAEREARAALGGGAVWRLHQWVALGGDVMTLLDRAEGERTAWSAGLLLAIPYSPHTLSIHRTNVNTATLQGGARGRADARWGFEFTIPFTPARYFRRPGEPVPAQPPGPPPEASGDTVEVVVRDDGFAPDTLEIAPGTTVVWVNRGELPHTATASDASWTSPLLMPGERWGRVFEEPGEEAYFCAPHPFMQATVVVLPPG